MNRKKNITHLKNAKNKKKLDIFIIGGGVNGAIAAASLSLAGYQVGLAEKNDFSSGSSQESSNLIWGGIKYLENFEFKLVWNLCRSRNQLLKWFPELIKEIRFYHPHNHNNKFPLFFIKIGVWLYWLLGRGKLRPPNFLSKKNIQHSNYPINLGQVNGGVEYSDAYLTENDSRLVLRLLKIAANAGAYICNYAEVTSLKKTDNTWKLTLSDATKKQSKNFTTEASYLINAAGPYLDLLNRKGKITSEHQHLFSKGAHIIVDSLLSENKILTFFSNDDRPFFVIPMGPRSCIGTTDTFQKKPAAQFTKADLSFILQNINSMLSLKKPLTQKNIISTRCGVRPLATKKIKIGNGKNSSPKNWINFSRKHILDESCPQTLMIYGGKLTDCLNLGSEVLAVCNKNLAQKITHTKILTPKQVFSNNGLFYKTLSNNNKKKVLQLCEDAAIKKTKLPLSIFLGMWRRHGEDAKYILEEMKRHKKNSQIILPTTKITLAEIIYMVKNEMVVTPEDLLRRRTMEKLVSTSRPQLLKSSKIIKKIIMQYR